MLYEVWKDIPNYEGLYQISNRGKVKSFCRKNTIILKGEIDRNGYERVILCKGKQHKSWTIHRLVGLTFLSNPHNYPQINHKDENKLNNNVDNLEWCTASYNNSYNDRMKRIGKKSSITKKGKHFSPRTEFKKGDNVKKVRCVELNKIYNSIKEASEELHIPNGNIVNVCKKKKYNKSAGGYKWEYC
jgi:hypothetical protein